MYPQHFFIQLDDIELYTFTVRKNVGPLKVNKHIYLTVKVNHEKFRTVKVNKRDSNVVANIYIEMSTLTNIEARENGRDLANDVIDCTIV